MADTLEDLRREIHELRAQLAKRPKPKAAVEFLGESLPAEILPELATGGKLSSVAVKTRPDGMYGDGRNLWLQVTPGGRSWIFRYRWGPKQREMGLGSLAEVSLAEARGRAAICRRLIKAGVDPIERRRAASAAVAVTGAKRVTFKQAAERYIEAHKSSWKNEKHADQWPATLESYVYPHFGEVGVGEVDTNLVLKALEPIWAAKPETASRIRGRIETVLDWATARGLRSGENPARRRGHLDHLLPRRQRLTRGHHAALPYADIHAFWTALAAREGAGAEALRFTIMTAARTGEVIGATWAEVDLKEKLWIVPAARMKSGREHRVPLSASAIEILERMKPLRTSDQSFIFPGRKPDAPLTNMAMLSQLEKMGRGDLTTHGFRSTFRDWAAETTSYPNEMVEMALAHTIGNKVEAAYRRGDMFEKRRRLMAAWAKHCLTVPSKGAKIIPMAGAR